MKWVKGKTKILHFPKTASVTFTEGNMVQLASGLVATATVSSAPNLGIILESVASTDSDFASTTNVRVEVPREPSAELESDVTTTLATTDVGNKFDLSDASTVNEAGSTTGVVTCVGFISSTKGRFVMNNQEFISNA